MQGTHIVIGKNSSLWTRLKQILCIVLVFVLIGCKSAYRLNMYSQPSGATVLVGSNFQGRTPCKIKIPRDSVLIRDHFIDITFKLDDGRRMTKTYDLKNYEPPNDLPGYIAAIIATPGIILLLLTETNEDDQYSPFDEEDDTEDDREIRLIALGFIGLGALVYYACYGDAEGLEGYDIYETFEDVDDVATISDHRANIACDENGY
jgi:hypothetical protein